jgi:hypothetical protein
MQYPLSSPCTQSLKQWRVRQGVQTGTLPMQVLGLVLVTPSTQQVLVLVQAGREQLHMQCHPPAHQARTPHQSHGHSGAPKGLGRLRR